MNRYRKRDGRGQNSKLFGHEVIRGSCRPLASVKEEESTGQQAHLPHTEDTYSRDRDKWRHQGQPHSGVVNEQ